MKKEYSILLSYGFLIGLSMLLLNDYYLKYEFGNWITGKLSDVTGLFIFPLFLLALFPKLGKKAFWGTALFFIWWKSPLSQFAIDGWNNLSLFPIGRVVDYSDLLALAILPVAYPYYNRERIALKTTSVIRYSVLSVSLFAFCATSYVKSGEIAIDYGKDSLVYEFPYSKDSLYARLHEMVTDTAYLRKEHGFKFDENTQLHIRRHTYRWDLYDTIDASITYTDYKTYNALQVPIKYPNSAKFLIGGSTDTSFLKLIYIKTTMFPTYSMDVDTYTKKKKKMRRLFERYFIKSLRKKSKFKK